MARPAHPQAPSASGPAWAAPHARDLAALMLTLGSSPQGLAGPEAGARLQLVGPNTLPEPKPPSLLELFVHQFRNPLIYILMVAAGIAILGADWIDAAFIGGVLLVNAVIGTIQEAQAVRSAAALRALVSRQALVRRGGESFDVDAAEVVPGDVVILEAGAKVPADLRLITAHGLEIDESLLTGESLPVAKAPGPALAQDIPLADRRTMAYAGTLVIRGRAQGMVVHTGAATELGTMASAAGSATPQPPLLVRMERFTTVIGVVILVAAGIVATIKLWQGSPWHEVLMLGVALAVSAIPEGLAVSLTVALAVATRRMARRHVIVRRLPSVEALGSCTYIASDKTGTLTVNALTARRLELIGGPAWTITGAGTQPDGVVLRESGQTSPREAEVIRRLCLTAVLANEGELSRRDGEWRQHGDAADVALLVMAHKAGVSQLEALDTHPQLTLIPFDPELRFAASFNAADDRPLVSVKVAVERLLSMCETMATVDGDRPLDPVLAERQAEALAAAGYRVLAFAAGPLPPDRVETSCAQDLHGLTLLGMVGLIDPVRPEAQAAMTACREAGIQVVMVTGDHPVTALAIARGIGLAKRPDQVITGAEIGAAIQAGGGALDGLIAGRRVFARVEPQQKLDIVKALQRQGHFVAVTGDGANDVPALRMAHVGVAMGRSGTDIARESADLILTDDNFASIVAGVEEGRIAYANVRKVVFLLVSTGAAELVLFFLSLAWRLPLPLLPLQVLWLNLVTNGIQDKTLAFEPGEGDELQRPLPAPE